MQTPPIPRLSIVIATWNAAKTIERCITSITNQSFTSWELLIKDGGSTDNTAALVERHKQSVAWWSSSPDAGIYDAWNHALAHAKGEYVCFLGADDAFHSKEALSFVFSAIGGSSYHLVTSRGQLRNSDWKATCVFGKSWKDSGMPRRIGICHPGTLHHRSLFESYGGFSTRLRIAADLEFLSRLPPDVNTLDLPYVTVDTQDDGISRNRFWQRIRETREVHAASPRVGPLKAWLYWADKAWRRPIARLLGLPH